MKKPATGHPESEMMSFGYDAGAVLHAIKQPLFSVSSFEFGSAEEAKLFFSRSSGQTPGSDEEGFIYSRLASPNVSLFEKRLSLYEGTEACAAFDSGMAAITTTLMQFLRPGDVLLTSLPLYGGTDFLVKKILPVYGVDVRHLSPGTTPQKAIQKIEDNKLGDRLAMIYIESPANPTNFMIDIAMYRALADRYSTVEKPVLLAMDNTYLGPLWQKPAVHRVDLVLYSATKYLGGHSDLVAGACCGSELLIKQVKRLRKYFGSILQPQTAWMLNRSLETLKVRMEAQQNSADRVARFLNEHPAVERVYYPGLLTEKDGEQFRIFHEQCLGAGAMISMDVKGGEPEAFRLLNALRRFKLAVSLGSTESLAQHPFTMTHANVDDADKIQYGISPALIRLSIGLEHPDDLIADLKQSLEAIATG